MEAQIFQFRDVVELELPFQPPVTIGPMKFKLDVIGEEVKKATPLTGFLHRGIEKILENKKWQTGLPYFDRVDYVSPIACAHAYILAVERLSGIKPSSRANSIRIAASELERVSSHLLSVGILCKTMGLSTAYLMTLRDRERVLNLFEMLCGARLTYTYLRVGGVANDISEGFIEKSLEFIDYFQEKTKEYNDVIFNNSIFKGRLSGLGVVKSADAINYSFSGPNLRASGIRFDIRKSTPYSNYNEIDFTVPTVMQSDCFSRVHLRFKEIEQSLQILRQVFKKIPEGSFCEPITRFFKVPEGESYARVESARGLFAVYIKSKDGKMPDRVKIRPPSLSIVQCLPAILKGENISDVPLIIASFDISASEVDR